MYSFRYLLLAAAAIVAASAGPLRRQPMELDEIINKTVCAIKVVTDYNPNRIPQRIRMLKCAKETNQWCEKKLMLNETKEAANKECCNGTFPSGNVMECREMTDRVLVFFKHTNTTDVIDVSVGCTCMIGRTTTAGTVSPIMSSR